MGAPLSDDLGVNSGFAYLLDAISGLELFKLTPADGAERDWFGSAVSLDAGVALVGAHFHDGVDTHSGAAYLFDTTTGVELAKLTPADGAANAWFGFSGCLDGGLALVGALGDAENGYEAGAAYVFIPSVPGVQYCAGDGLPPHTPCPYGNDNDGGVGGCDWGNPAFPGGGVLIASGSDRLAGADTYLIATGVSNDFGLFFAADNLVGGGNGSPLTDGLRCAGGNVVRFPLPPLLPTTHSAVSGPLQLIDPGLTAGSPRRYQYWFRTKHGPGGQMANLTNGLEIFWRP